MKCPLCALGSKPIRDDTVKLRVVGQPGQYVKLDREMVAQLAAAAGMPAVFPIGPFPKVLKVNPVPGDKALDE